MPKQPKIDDVIDKTVKGVSSEVATKPGTAVADFRAKMAALVVQTQKAEAPQGGFLSTKGGRLSVGGVPLPGDMIRAIIIDYRKDNEFYDTAYDPKGQGAPVCFAVRAPHQVMSPWRAATQEDEANADSLVWSDDDQMVSECDSPQVPAGSGCDSCKMLEFGSAKFIKGAVRTKGKACRESRRIHVFAADQCTTPADVERASYMTLIPPPTSLVNFSKVANEITGVLGVPIFCAVVDIEVKPHDDYLFMVHYKIVEQIKDEGVLFALLKRHEQISAKPIVMPKKDSDDKTKEQRGSGKF